MDDQNINGKQILVSSIIGSKFGTESSEENLKSLESLPFGKQIIEYKNGGIVNLEISNFELYLEGFFHNLCSNFRVQCLDCLLECNRMVCTPSLFELFFKTSLEILLIMLKDIATIKFSNKWIRRLYSCGLPIYLQLEYIRPFFRLPDEHLEICVGTITHILRLCVRLPEPLVIHILKFCSSNSDKYQIDHDVTDMIDENRSLILNQILEKDFDEGVMLGILSSSLNNTDTHLSISELIFLIKYIIYLMSLNYDAPLENYKTKSICPHVSSIYKRKYEILSSHVRWCSLLMGCGFISLHQISTVSPYLSSLLTYIQKLKKMLQDMHHLDGYILPLAKNKRRMSKEVSSFRYKVDYVNF